MCPPGGHIGVIWRIRLKLCFLWPTRVYKQNGKSIGSAVSVQTADGKNSLYLIYSGRPFPQKLPLLVGIWTLM